jgi:hypothetical protein
VQTTQLSNESLSIDQAAELLVQPEDQLDTPEAEEIEDSQPETDESVDVDEVDDDQDDDIVEDVDDDSEEESDAEEADEDDDEASDAEDDEADDDDESDPEENLYTVKVDGEEKQVTLDELKQSFSGQQFIQKKMQENAAVKKEAESAYAALMQERQNLQQLVQSVQQGQLTPPAQPDPDKFVDDPFGWHEAQMTYQKQLNEYNVQAQAVTEQLQAQTQADMQLRAKYAQAEAQELVNKLPELKDPKQAKVFSESITKAAENLGYSAEEVSGITNHRDMMTLYYASQWLKSQSGDSKKIVAEKSRKARKPIKAGVKKTVSKGRERQKAISKLKKTGSVEDALSLILEN